MTGPAPRVRGFKETSGSDLLIYAAIAARRANAACNEGLDKLLARMGPTAPGKQ